MHAYISRSTARGYMLATYVHSYHKLATEDSYYKEFVMKSIKFKFHIQSLRCALRKIQICDWLWENPPVTHKDKYLEIRNSIIQSVIS